MRSVPRASLLESEISAYKIFDKLSKLAAKPGIDVPKLTSGAYSKVFHEPKQSKLFRGMGASERYLRKILKLKDGTKIPDKGSKVASFTYSPRGDGVVGSSWTVVPKTAMGFSGESDFQIIMQASKANNPAMFVSGPDGLYGVPGLDSYEHENESIGLGDIKVSKIYWRRAGSGVGSFTSKDIPPVTPPKKTKKSPEKSPSKSKKTSKKPAKKATKK